MSATEALIAVLDLGKTNLKVLLATPDGEPVDRIAAANDATRSQPYLAYDLDRLEAFFLDALAELAQRHAIGAVVATAHGCAAVLVDETGPVLPMMDYEAPSPAWLDAAYAEQGPDYREVFCPVSAGVLRAAQQLMWQEREFPESVSRARHYLMAAQYFAWRLGGRPATEISQIAAQNHLWAPLAGGFSSIVMRRGWQRLLPSFAKAGEVLGTIAPTVAARTGLAPQTHVLCGVHDSNANLYRYKAAGMAEATILSTGTWMIGFSRARPLATLEPGRAMVANVDVDGEPIASTLTMTGREYAVLAGEASAADEEALAATRHLIERRTFALPSFVEDDGAFPGRASRGRILGPPPETPAEKQALASLYAAFYADFCLSALASRAPVVVDGGFAANLVFGRLLAALRPEVQVLMSRSREGTALGAALLWKRFERRQKVTSVALDPVSPYPVPGLAGAAREWARLAAE